MKTGRHTLCLPVDFNAEASVAVPAFYEIVFVYVDPDASEIVLAAYDYDRSVCGVVADCGNAS